ncbi:hypothetical protein FW774_17730 [Pedobacter sp. BS3]|uniref:hypothetical protein n=1 Tax=Pedobacter sp. BS3 TaxID=2567937 RepID=UPI0011F099D4|nr:hypothetical protein [Pedobacter sp. BS3]TZF81884.1 hypothetical protein FW774_17730 [Pedobacter sp. BS3]
MMRLLFVLVLCYHTAFTQDMKTLRNRYYEALQHATSADKLYDEMKGKTISDPLVMAYWGSVQALKARYSWNPYNKIKYLKQGLQTLQLAVNRDAGNLEIRFLRFTLEYYIPAFLGYSNELTTDRVKIVELLGKKRFGKLDKPLVMNIVQFMKDNGKCTPAELKVLNSVSYE